MVLEIDPINPGTKGKMMDVLTGLIAGGQCKSFKETKMKAMDLEIIVKAYRKRTNEDPDQSLLASVLSNIIGQKTKEKFSDLKMLHSYKDMKQNILETATEANMNVNRMDIGNVDAEKMAMHFNIGTPDGKANPPQGESPPQSPPVGGNQESLNAAEQGKGPDLSQIQCYNCLKYGHKSIDCPTRPSKGKGKGWPNQKGNAWKGGYDVGWGQQKGKGWSKGCWQKGKGGKGVNNIDENWGRGDWYPEGVPLCAIYIIGDDDEIRDEDICGMCCEEDEDNRDTVQALSEPVEPEEDEVSMADSEDVPKHVDSDSEEETEPEWVRQRGARPDPNMMMQAAWKKAEETDENNKKILSGQPPRGRDADWIRAHEKTRMMRDSSGNDGKVSCSK